MKKLNEWLLMSFVAMLLGTSACSSGDDNEPITPEFPTSQTLNVSANTEQTFAFTANLDWQLSSNATWCTFPEIGEKAQTISGKAGSQVIKIKITDENLKFDQTTEAKLTLKMEEASQIIATITRSAKEYELKIYDKEGKEINLFAIASEGSLEFAIEANFEFAATNFPTWTTIEMVQDETNAGIMKGTITVNEDAIKYPQKASETNVVKFANQSGTASFNCPVTYTGMAADKISFTPNSQWGVSVAKDGKTYKTQALDGSTQEDKTAPYAVTISALNDEYNFVYYKYDSQYGWTKYQTEYAGVEQPWFIVSDDKKGNINVSFNANLEEERNGYLLVFPKTIYESISSDIDNKILDTSTERWELKTEYEKYVIAEFVQESGVEASTTGFKVINSLTYTEINNTKVTDPDIIDVVRGNCLYTGDEIYSIKANPDTPILIYPQLPETSWTCDMGAMIEGDANPIVEGYIDESYLIGQHALQYRVPQEPTGNIFIVIRNPESWTIFKVLVIIPNK